MIRLEVWGDYALFTRPEFKAERATYDVMTPSAAVGLLESIYWHPGVKYVIERIYVCNPIRYFNIRRNERSAVISASKVKTAMENGDCNIARNPGDSIVQRGNTVLKNVRYVIEAHIEMTVDADENNNLGKAYGIFNRRLEKGQCYKQPCFGIREYDAFFKPCDEIPPCPEELLGTRDLGWMVHRINFEDPLNVHGNLFRATLVNGVLEVPFDASVEVSGSSFRAESGGRKITLTPVKKVGENK